MAGPTEHEPYDLWWKNTVVYCLDVETYFDGDGDGDGDGLGDFEGLIQRPDHLSGLGVDCVWLMPFYPTPNRDDGYDVVDYYGVDPRLGDLGSNQYRHLALARGHADPLRKALDALPDIPPNCQWANFLRNHDELTLDELTEAERHEVLEAFGPDDEMQVYGRGIRRRLPSMLGGDVRRLRMAYSLLFSLPGTPVLFYGEEIGMGENLDVPGRRSLRTPMQWKPEANGGFTRAGAEAMPRSLVEGDFGPEHGNMADQMRDPDSMLGWMQRLIGRRPETPEFGMGTGRLIDVGASEVLAVRSDWGRTVGHRPSQLLRDGGGG